MGALAVTPGCHPAVWVFAGIALVLAVFGALWLILAEER